MTATVATQARPPLPPLNVGDPVPWFTLPSLGNPEFKFHSLAGMFVVLSFFGSAGDRQARAHLDALLAQRALFDDRRVTFFGVSNDPADRDQKRVEEGTGVRYFFDYDKAISRQFLPADGGGVTYILDPTLRVVAGIRYDDPRGHDAAIVRILRNLPAPERHAGVELNAPVLVVPRIFEPGLCRKLIELYDSRGGEDSGFMREQDGKTVSAINHAFKRRQDCTIDDEGLRTSLMRRIYNRLVPEIAKAFQFRCTRMERYIVACYDADIGGYFKPHRDNTTKGTAHRRFACTINLNAEEYEGGDLRFPEFGQRTYRAPTGGAVVFSCSLMHEATPVTKGKRYAFLPFLYDDAAAKIREANNSFLGDGVNAYRNEAEGGRDEQQGG
jgi:predicted 2-oxoglutarate/Fe(II)-dependent dioxygenase YbiX/peroxiredoxin